MPLDMDELGAFERSVIVHQLADGRACAKLLDHDTDASAMLLERLGPNLADLHYSIPSIDPEGVRSERAHDLAVPLREYNEPLLVGDTAQLVRARAYLLAGICDIDPEPVWQWGFIERVSTGLANLRDFDDESGAQFLEVAERCL